LFQYSSYAIVSIIVTKKKSSETSRKTFPVCFETTKMQNCRSVKLTLFTVYAIVCHHNKRTQIFIKYGRLKLFCNQKKLKHIEFEPTVVAEEAVHNVGGGGHFQNL